MPYMTLVPAYGRDYKNKKELLMDWESDKDFLIQDISSPDNGRYVNKPQLVGKGYTVNIRYKELRNVAVVKVQ